jgi:hypothetical protein
MWLSGKDYSNPRVADFVNLSKPEEDMYDRTKVHRMPWYVLYGAIAMWVGLTMLLYSPCLSNYQA